METYPPEIIHIIASHLSKGSLARCLRVSKAWSDQFIPFVWRGVQASNRRQRKAFDNPEFTLAVLRHGRHIQTLIVNSYRHLKPFLQELPSPAQPSVDDDGVGPIPCVRNLRTFELNVLQPIELARANHPILEHPSMASEPLFSCALDVSLEDPPLVLQLFKNNPLLQSARFGGYCLEQEWLLKRDRVLVGPDLSSPSSLAQLTPNLKNLLVHTKQRYGRSFRPQTEPLARLLLQVPKTVEAFVLGGTLEDTTWQSNLTRSSTPPPLIRNTAPLEEPADTAVIEEPLPTSPLSVQKLFLNFQALPVDSPGFKSFIESFGTFLRRCVHLKWLQIALSDQRHRDANVGYIVGYLEEARPKMLSTLKVVESLEDKTLARLLDCARLVGGEDDNTVSSTTDIAEFHNNQQDQKGQEQDHRQYGWRILELGSHATLGPLSSAALMAQCPTLKSLNVVNWCPSEVLVTILTSSPGLTSLTTIEACGDQGSMEYEYNAVDARQLWDRRLINIVDGGWACTGLQTLKMAITNVPRPDCQRSQYKARLSPARNGTAGLTCDIEEKAQQIQREVCRQLGKLTQLRVLWLGHETRDFGDLQYYRIIPKDRRQELGIPDKDPRGSPWEEEEEKEEEENNVKELLADVKGKDEREGSEEDEDEGGDEYQETDEEDEEDEEEEYDDDEFDEDTDTDQNGMPLYYPLMFLNPNFQYSCLPLTLESGLDLLSELKELRELNVEQMAHRVGVKEARWMLDNWPKLEKVIGLAVKGEANEAAYLLKQERPWIELPESVNNLRQSTWEHYYPPMLGY